MRGIIIFILFILGTSTFVLGQESTYSTNAVKVHIIDGDTLPYVLLPEYNYVDYNRHRTRKEQRKWNKLIYNVVKVYPYAQITGELLEYYDDELSKIENEEERKKFMEGAEAVLKEEFKGEIMELTVSQGKVLVKLIDRETGKTSYELIKDLRSGFTAFMWNSIAIIFGNNLKAKYDPEEDADIEEIILMIERGELVVAWRDATTAKARVDLDKKKRKELRKKERRERKELKKKA